MIEMHNIYPCSFFPFNIHTQCTEMLKKPSNGKVVTRLLVFHDQILIMYEAWLKWTFQEKF